MGRCSYAWPNWDAERFEQAVLQCHKETWEGSDKYCIFHDPSPDKDVDLFKEKLEEQMQTGTEYHDFRGCYFPENWDFSGQEFKDADFEKATFQGDASFWGATFQNADFRGVTFQSNANFRGVTFKDIAGFEKATFHNADFRGVTFKDADFEKAAFWYADFRGVTFKDANFRGVTFKDIAGFSRCFFKVATFSRATFHNADFRGVTFKDIAGFIRATFHNADFRGVTFKDIADFSEAFFKDADFEKATFQSTAGFSRATFQSTAGFSRATFQNADFSEAFFQNADFSEIRIKESFEFNLREVSGLLDFRGAKFFFSGSITFDLENTLFHRAHLQNTAFVDCTWPNDYIIYEEKHMNDKDIDLSFNQLETIYRDLKQTIQNHGDYTTAGEFYYREMEMRRKGATMKNRIWLTVYRALAGYGEKPGWVVRNSLIIILLGAVLFFFSGVARVGADIPPESSPYIIDYSINSLDFCWNMVPDFYYCFYYSVVTFTTLGYGDIHPVGYYSHAIAFSEAFIGAFFMALFVVVFARKMMR